MGAKKPPMGYPTVFLVDTIPEILRKTNKKVEWKKQTEKEGDGKPGRREDHGKEIGSLHVHL